MTRSFAWRCWFIFTLLFWFPAPIGAFPLLGDVVSSWAEQIRAACVPWLARHLLGVTAEISTKGTGSGDRLYDWLGFGLAGAAAIILGATWTAIASGRVDDRWRDALRTYVRWVVGVTLLQYGFIKVFPLQFVEPPTVRLLQNYGAASPMALMWTFMGFSPAYAAFGGAAEVLGGALLLFRRTALLGSLIVAAVMSNVVMMNFCYDVPVKLRSSALLLMSTWLAAPSLAPLLEFFVWGRTARQPPDPVEWSRLWRWPSAALKTFVVVSIAATAMWQVQSYQEAGAYEAGFFSISSYESDQAIESPWRAFELNSRGIAYIVRGDGQLDRFWFLEDEQGAVTLKPRDDATAPMLSLERIDHTHWNVTGPLRGATVKVGLTRTAPPSFPLLERGFHWVNEYPYNR